MDQSVGVSISEETTPSRMHLKAPFELITLCTIFLAPYRYRRFAQAEGDDWRDFGTCPGQLRLFIRYSRAQQSRPETMSAPHPAPMYSEVSRMYAVIFGHPRDPSSPVFQHD